MQTLLHNIGQLMVVPKGPVPGSSMSSIEVIQQASVLIRDDVIEWFGEQSAQPTIDHDCIKIDALGGCVTPGFIDCHTHTVFAGSREQEFAMRCAGRSYEDIARTGGGIRNTMESVRAATADTLVRLAQQRLRHMLLLGVTTVEIKSGYGLTVDDELKMLDAIGQLDSRVPTDIVATYLGAHTVPPEFEGKPDAYLEHITSDEVLSRIATLGLAEFCDVFCENIAFDVDQSRKVLMRAKKHGLTPKVHADQIAQIGASKLAAEMGAVSADHLETIDQDGIRAMANANTIAVLLPGCSFFLGVDQAPARQIVDSGLPVALATDFNPGSSMISSLPLVMSIACSQMNMTPTECLVACTANAAAALQRHDRLGAIDTGMQADLVVIDFPNFDRFCYECGHYPVHTVIKAGRVVASNSTSY